MSGLYSEIRDWSVWLQCFTVSDLADAMGVDHEVAQRGIDALLWHGICWADGFVDSRGERIIMYVPLPAGPREHPHEAPEWRTCDMQILSPRGMPVRIRSDRDTRQKMAGDMSARRRLKEQERAYQRQQAAMEDRATKNRQRAEKLPKWKRK